VGTRVRLQSCSKRNFLPIESQFHVDLEVKKVDPRDTTPQRPETMHPIALATARRTAPDYMVYKAGRLFQG
jgi:hypothetical protein